MKNTKIVSIFLFFAFAPGFLCFADTGSFKLYKQGLDLSIEGDFRAAESKFKKALQVDKLDRLAQECLTLIYEYDNGSVDKEFIVAQFKGAKAVFDKDYRKALSEFKLSLDKSPDSALANNNVGVAYLYEGAFDEAIKYFRRAISLDKKYLDGWTNLAYTYNKAKIDPQKAKECALEAI